jgi:hypothetical protein
MRSRRQKRRAARCYLTPRAYLNNLGCDGLDGSSRPWERKEERGIVLGQVERKPIHYKTTRLVGSYKLVGAAPFKMDPRETERGHKSSFELALNEKHRYSRDRGLTVNGEKSAFFASLR